MKKYPRVQTVIIETVAFISVFFACCSTNRAEEAPNVRLVVRQDYDVSQHWQPRQIMGRDFWHILGVSGDNHPDKGPFVKTDMRKLVNRPLFKESGLNYMSIDNITVPGSNKVSISAMTPPNYLALIDARPNAPFFLMPGDVRPIYRLTKQFDCDQENYNAWKKAHPNFMGCINGETDNDFLSFAPWTSRWGDTKNTCPELAATIKRNFPAPRNREELTAMYMKGCEAYRQFFFDDADKASYLRAGHCHDHYYYESGAGVGWLETTNTASPDGRLNYRHQASLFFARGASRQYHKNWGWFLAVFYNGYDDKGIFSGDNRPNYQQTSEAKASPYRGPGSGMSPSLVTRDMFLAYLSGASFVEHESWWGYLRPTVGDGLFDLSSPLGKAWEDWFNFTRKNPQRGVSYAPVALLVPFEQGYPNYGGQSWQMFQYERPDWMIDAFMFTIMPHSPVTKSGREGALANSPYGDIYDVIVPNTPKQPVSLEVLNSYKAAVMLGRYPKNKALAERMVEYVENGGTLLLNIKQVNEFFPETFLGFERARAGKGARDMSAMEVRGPVRSLSDGKTFALPDKYEMVKIKLKGATPLLKDAGGNVLACKNSFGKGHVIVSTVDFMVPKNNMDNQNWDVLGKMVYDKEFPFVQYFLRNIVSEVLPLEVKGDIEYGLNKLDDGWLLYLINNKGVTKFTNKEQILDMSKTAKVEVFLKDIDASTITELRGRKTIQRDDKKNSFTVDILPGDVRVVKIGN